MRRTRRRTKRGSKRANAQSSKTSGRSNALRALAVTRLARSKPRFKNLRPRGTKPGRPRPGSNFVASATRTTQYVARKSLAAAGRVGEGILAAAQPGLFASPAQQVQDKRRLNCQPRPKATHGGAGSKRTKRQRNQAFIPWCEAKRKP